ncbi:hypothetical protein PUNSTDRAFT_131637 [Punctularia strigosozonata HHB-11173 SS5]|uniref:uncharacterized protein n=1 Tax=Punctularia strigosozonata (strain HHB-11173) TaxID=741275 RepID=UPI000441865C|nr:uncharacterized protein PUNSTDRAFT_131637 [Punctularia strigosozonata HHB-11173 SS5]EIN11469.1 hypothetical protein PUNSTDRAFT_131637 [Punctularia strigosozonata HHB-11173 SS5]
MENPHNERQAVLLERIVKNSNKATELFMELNRALEEIHRANASIRTAADLVTKYRQNVKFNFEVQGSSEPKHDV